MTIEQDVLAALEDYGQLVALVEDRIYPDKLPQNPEYPNVVYTRNEGQTLLTLQGESGRKNAIFSFDVRALTAAECGDVTEHVKEAINQATAFTVVFQSLDTFPYEWRVETYRRILTFSVWFT